MKAADAPTTNYPLVRDQIRRAEKRVAMALNGRNSANNYAHGNLGAKCVAQAVPN